MTRALVVAEERKLRRILQIVLEGLEIHAVVVTSAEEALEAFGRQPFDLVLTDLKLPGMGALAMLPKLREIDADVPVIVLTAYATVQSAVDAMKLGAFDFILKPFAVENLELLIRRARDLRRVQTENVVLREQASQSPPFESLVGTSAAMREVYATIRQVAPARSSVMITGEPGTGKEVVARAIHKLSPRADHVFVALNCAAIPADMLDGELFGHARSGLAGARADHLGKLALANGGTLFLDEIGELPLPLQAKLLRVLQEGVVERTGTGKVTTVDVRVLASSNCHLHAATAEGRFLDDLYLRLNAFHIHMPPLRERREDVGVLARFFLERFAREMGKGALELTEDAERALTAYDWPGNVRELQNLMERAAVLAKGPQVGRAAFALALPAVAAAAAPGGPGEMYALEPAVVDVERRTILRALGAASDNKAQAARLLGVSERTLWYKLKRYGL